MAEATADIGDFCPALQLGYHSIQSSILYDVRGIARPKHRAHRAEQAAGLVVPFDPAAGFECAFDQRLRLIQSRDSIKSATHVAWTFLVREYHRLLRRQF